MFSQLDHTILTISSSPHSEGCSQGNWDVREIFKKSNYGDISSDCIIESQVEGSSEKPRNSSVFEFTQAELADVANLPAVPEIGTEVQKHLEEELKVRQEITDDEEIAIHRWKSIKFNFSKHPDIRPHPVSTNIRFSLASIASERDKETLLKSPEIAEEIEPAAAPSETSLREEKSPVKPLPPEDSIPPTPAPKAISSLQRLLENFYQSDDETLLNTKVIAPSSSHEYFMLSQFPIIAECNDSLAIQPMKKMKIPLKFTEQQLQSIFQSSSDDDDTASKPDDVELESQFKPTTLSKCSKLIRKTIPLSINEFNRIVSSIIQAEPLSPQATSSDETKKFFEKENLPLNQQQPKALKILFKDQVTTLMSEPPPPAIVTKPASKMIASKAFDGLDKLNNMFRMDVNCQQITASCNLNQTTMENNTSFTGSSKRKLQLKPLEVRSQNNTTFNFDLERDEKLKTFEDPQSHIKDDHFGDFCRTKFAD